MKKTLSFSIITPSFNQGVFIERTIQSVLQQGIPDLEYFVMDGGSADLTLDVLSQYQGKLSFISEPDNGQAHAVNKGLMETSGDIIGWLNSDDIYFPETLAYVRDFFESHPEVDIIYGNANHIDEFDRVISAYPTQDWNLKNLIKNCYISQPAVFFRRRILAEVGMLDEKLHYCMDYEFWLRCGLKNMKFAHLSRVLAGSRLYPGTKTTNSAGQNHRETIKMLHDKFGHVPMIWLVRYVVRSQLAFSYPGEKFNFGNLKLNFMVVLNVLREAVRWNGFKRGLIDWITFPKAVIELSRLNRRNAISMLDKKI